MNIPEISVDKIIEKIRDEVVGRKGGLPVSGRAKPDRMPSRPLPVGKRGIRRAVDDVLWKYGTMHAETIKRIPFIRKIAEEKYWNLTRRRINRSVEERSPQFSNSPLDFLGANWNYHCFLDQAKQEGLKGRLKLFIFKFIGFFAWWQGQINRGFLEETNRLENLIADNDRMIRDLLNRKIEELTADTRQTQDVLNQVREHKHHILDQQRRLALLLDEVRKRSPSPTSARQMGNILEEKNHLLDAFYVSFEDQFRGTREDIKERVGVYLPYIEKNAAGTEQSPVVDIGCGRGEWLEVLKENGRVARGVDINRVMIGQCRELGLNVAESDAIEYLKNEKADTLGAVTGFHIIEHLSLHELVMLLTESLRVLKQGGLVIFETPNPENLLVGASTFYIDLTHQRPLYPDAVRFLLEYLGFVRTEILRLHRRAEPVYTGEKFIDEALYLLNREQDYAVIGYKD